MTLPFDDDAEEIVDPETGEIDWVPAGPEDMAQMAALALEAKEQVKAWTTRYDRLRYLIQRQQVEQRAIYGDVTARLNQRFTFDSKAFFDVVEDAGLDYTDLLELLRHATGISSKGLPKTLAYYVERAKTPGKAFLTVDRVRKLAQENPECLTP